MSKDKIEKIKKAYANNIPPFLDDTDILCMLSYINVLEKSYEQAIIEKNSYKDLVLGYGTTCEALAKIPEVKALILELQEARRYINHRLGLNSQSKALKPFESKE